jgi:hypothetical protein
MESSVKTRPFGAITLAPAFTDRLASGMSAVTTILPGFERSAIQLSASSMPDGTITRSIIASRGTLMKELETT